MNIEPPAVFELSSSDRLSPTWSRLLAHLNDKLAIARAKNDGDQTLEMTWKLRGQIGVLKALIQLDTELPDITE